MRVFQRFVLVLIVIVLALSNSVNSQCYDDTAYGGASSDRIGLSVSTALGYLYEFVLTGASRNDDNGSDAGKVFVYVTPGLWYKYSITGEAAGDRFGWSVASTDNTSDALPRFVVGAPYKNTVGVEAGRAYLYQAGYSSPTLIRTFDGEAAGDHFGRSVGIGDLDGDGYAEVIVGAPENDFAGADAGRVYVYSGIDGSILDTLTGEAAGDEFGSDLTVIGDYDGDTYNDFLVGAQYHSTGGTKAGRAYVYSGATLSLITTFDGEGSYHYFSRGLASAGDINNDGREDIVIGADQQHAGAPGAVYVYSGIDNTLLHKFYGESNFDMFGASVTSCDMNLDGVNDIIVGASSNDDAANRAGKVYIYSGVDFSLLDTYLGENVDDFFGSAVDALSVYSYPDEWGELVIGAFGRDGLYWDAGAIFTIGAHRPLPPPGTFVGEEYKDSFGSSVADAGDFNGDGYNDIIVGAPRPNATEPGYCRAYVYSGLDSTLLIRITGENENDDFGYSVAGAGDVNGDGTDDIIVGAPSVGTYATSAGTAYIFFGGVYPPAYDWGATAADVIINGLTDWSNLGGSVAGAGDVDGDGFDDVLIGAFGNNSNPSNAYLFKGGPGLTGTFLATDADATITEPIVGNYLGSSVSSAGNLNGDGNDDIIIAADRTGNGTIYIFYGGSGLTGSLGPSDADITITGEASGDYFGNSISGIDDFDGDGNNDIIVGAPFNDAGGDGAGRTYTFLMPPSGSNMGAGDADIIITGEAEGDRFGSAIGGFFDFNGDGYGDAIVGADNNDGEFSNSGKAYVYLGGSSVALGHKAATDADLSFSGDWENDYFGRSVAGVRDTVGDGPDKIIIGANFGRGYCYNTGQAFLFLNPTLCGDANGDGAINVGDAVHLINYVFKSGDPADPICVADTNGDAAVNVGDAVHLINYVFKGGDPPEPCCQ